MEIGEIPFQKLFNAAKQQEVIMDIQKIISEGKEVKNLGFRFDPQTEFTRARCSVEELLKHYKIKMHSDIGGNSINLSSASPIFYVSTKKNFGMAWPRPGKSAAIVFAPDGDEIHVGIHGLNNPEGETFFETGSGMYRIIGYGFNPVDLGDNDARKIEFSKEEKGFTHIEISRELRDGSPHWVVRHLG